jgi:hypothetical protein
MLGVAAYYGVLHPLRAEVDKAVPSTPREPEPDILSKQLRKRFDSDEFKF